MTKFLLLCTIAYHSLMHGFDPCTPYAPLRMPYRAIQVAADRYSISVGLAYAVAQVESSMRPGVEFKGSIGLFQIRYDTWRYYYPMMDRKRLFEAEYNADWAMFILRQYYNQTGSWDRALLRYNCGFKFKNPQYLQKIYRYMRCAE